MRGPGKIEIQIEGDQCRRCGSLQTEVIERRYRKKVDRVIRRRRCLECGYKWNTVEIYEDVWRDMVEREKNIHRTAYTRIKRTDKCGY